MAYPEPTAAEVDAALSVLDACRAARKAGIKIVRKKWMQRRSGKQELACACALGAYAHVKLGMLTRSPRMKADLVGALHVSDSWIVGFIIAFDNEEIKAREMSDERWADLVEQHEQHRAYTAGYNHAAALNRMIRDGQV